MDREPDRFGAAGRSEVESAAARLSIASRREDNPRVLAAEIKQFKTAVDRYLPVWRTSTVREYVEAIVVALVLALFIRQFIVQAFKIPSGSMIPTLRIGDQLLVNKFIYGFDVPFVKRKILPFRGPRRGEIIVFRFPSDPSKDYIKRVVGVPGDHVRMEKKRLYINGEEVEREYIGEYRYTEDEDPSGTVFNEKLGTYDHPILLADPIASPMDSFSLVVPEGKYFCMGDNRDRSNDSRYWGFVDAHLILGKAMVIYFSWPPAQWTRILDVVHAAKIEDSDLAK
ncbi:signal peptidase I [bacterium]|nr:signal peptidase I [bacterium]